MTTGKVDIELDTTLDTKADDNWHNRYKTFLFYRGSSYTRQSSPPTSIADPHQMECSDIFQFQFQFDGEVSNDSISISNSITISISIPIPIPRKQRCKQFVPKWLKRNLKWSTEGHKAPATTQR